MLGRMNGGGDPGLAPVCMGAVPTNLSRGGADAAAGAADDGPPAMTQTNRALGASAPHAVLLLCTPPPDISFLDAVGLAGV